MKEQILKILKTSSKRFGKYGYRKTTIEEIAGDLRMTKSSLYYYFRSKEDIFLAAIDFEIENYIEGLNKKLSALDNINEIIKNFLQNKNAFLQEYRLFKELFSFYEDSDFSEKLIKFKNKLFKKEIETLESLFKKQISEKEKARELAFICGYLGFSIASIKHFEFSNEIDIEGLFKILAKITIN